jgi:hypothetical protein
VAKIATKLDRIQWSILALGIVSGAALYGWRGAEWGAGGLAGGVVGYLNFRWLRATVERMLGNASSRTKVRAGVAYAFKFAVLAVVLAGLVLWGGMQALAILIGIGAMPLGIIGESIWTAVWPPPAESDEG